MIEDLTLAEVEELIEMYGEDKTLLDIKLDLIGCNDCEHLYTCDNCYDKNNHFNN